MVWRQVGSHYHFIETNKCLVFDREKAYGRRLNVPSGSAVRFEPGDSKVVTLVEIGGKKRVVGTSKALESTLSDAFQGLLKALKLQLSGCELVRMMLLMAFGVLIWCSQPMCWLWSQPSRGTSNIARRMRPEHKRAARRGARQADVPKGLLAKQMRLTREVNECSSVDAVLQTVQGTDIRMDEMNEINLSACLHKIGELRQTVSKPLRGSPVFKQIVQRTKKLAAQMQLQAEQRGVFIAQVLVAVAKGRDTVPELQELLPDTLEALHQTRCSDQMNVKQAVNSLWALATLHAYCPHLKPALRLQDVFKPLANCIIERKHELIMQGIDNTLWAVARLHPSVPRQCEELQPVLLQRCSELLSREDYTKASDRTSRLRGIARVAFALSFLDSKDPGILDQITSIFLMASSGVQNGQECLPYIDVLCSFAKLQHADDSLVSAAAHLPFSFSRLRDWDIAALTWAYQELDPEQKHQAFQKKLKSEVARRKLTQAQIEQSQFGYEEWESGMNPGSK